MKKRLLALFSALSALPTLSATAGVPLLIGGIGAGVSIAGFSIYRTMAPVNMGDALSFFSSCWTCGLFNDVIGTLSILLPNIYRAIGLTVIPIMIGMAAVWIAWNVLASWLGIKKEVVDMTKDGGAWALAGQSVRLLVKMSLVSALLLAPLPRMITMGFVEPIFNIGLSISNGAAAQFATPENRNAFEACLIATAVEGAMDARNHARGAFSPQLRHNLTCQLGGIHQMTGLGMTVGWTMLNAAFDARNMHKFIFGIPIFPNVLLFIAGAIIVFLFFTALIPIPLYFLEIIMKLSLDLIMLPLFFLSWLFKDWSILPKDGGAKIKGMIDNLIKGTVGIATVGVFLVFSIMFLNAMFGEWNGAEVLREALERNDSRYLVKGLMLNNDSIITIIMAGIFIMFFMTSIPKITNSLFSGIAIPDEYYTKAKKDATAAWGNVKKWYQGLQK